MNIFEFIKTNPKVKTIIESDKFSVSDTCDGFNIMLLASDFMSGNSTLFVVLPSLYLAQRYYDSLSRILPFDDVLFFPADELASAEMISASGDFLFERIETLYELLTNNKKLVIMNMHAAIKYEMNPQIWRESCFNININDEIEPQVLANKLIKIGYTPVYQVTKTGEFSKRGSIIDIFPLGYEVPVRLDFFDNYIETIKEFDCETQKSIEKKNNVLILPVSELIYDDNDYKFARTKILGFEDNFSLSEIEEDIYKKDLSNLMMHKSLDTLSRYLSFFDESKTNIFDFVENKRIYLIDPKKSYDVYQRLELDLDEYCGRIGGYSITKMDNFINFKEIEKKGNIIIEGLSGIGDANLSVVATEIDPYHANQKNILNDFSTYRFKKFIIAITNKDRLKRLVDYLDENGIIVRKINDFSNIKEGIIYSYDNYLPSFNMKKDDLVIINEHDIFDIDYHATKARYKSIYKNARKISNYDELEIGDYVVHYDYGIGIYSGIVTLDNTGIKRDFIHVSYKNNSALYIPLEKINDLSKYASKDTEGVEIHEIGGTAWARTKARVKKRLHDISDKLIKLYAQRKQSEGFKFPPDSEEQIQFENEFEYELTPDQSKAIRDIKRDMESNRPMDRLVCGDVGYGKTEVALRAAFKAVYGGKQVSVLAPTTILARQHYLTFKNRMEKYGIRVELLSRFVSRKKQTEVIADTLKGSVDVLIGTHRILSDEVKFKDLGLLIVDEEQRFGVTHKEKIKELKVNVDCITLSATPIPRTLQMSVMGLKDLSMIETPPKNRYPIQTYVTERNDRIIADAIKREMTRGGQVFYLYNWTDSIEDEAAKIKSLVPDARICVGHGKLSKDKLEDVITDFIDKKYDVLICTTIIETGIDIPDTNTLIIHDADRLGLSQMYQIRGRVGRSNKIAYAYLMYEPRKILTKEAEKRLETIKEFNELGSGFRIAMRDLSIRGSGDLLGEEQSGFVESVGIDMYLKILDEEINNGGVTREPKKIDSSITAPLVSRTIDSAYIETDDMRIKIHKRINKIKSYEEANKLISELQDRFGEVPNDLLLYIYEKTMDNYCEKLDIKRIDRSNKASLIFYFSKEKSEQLDGSKLFDALPEDNMIRLGYSKQREIYVTLFGLNMNKENALKSICEFFDRISAN